jgi:5-methylcytosine-specific restriction endonuclease McrA
MKQKRSASPRRPDAQVDERRLSDLVAESRQAQHEREKGYREQSLNIHPWVCARCGREFTRTNLHLLTVHHKDHNHEHNPADGSNWENLCVYCHDNEHTRYLDHLASQGAEVGEEPGERATYKPFAALKGLLEKKKRS